MWFYLCRRCARGQGKYREVIPRWEIEEWKRENDPRATCEWCRKRDSYYYVEGPWRAFNPSFLRKMGIRVPKSP